MAGRPVPSGSPASTPILPLGDPPPSSATPAALAVRCVVEQRDPAPPGHEPVGPAVAVVVPDGGAVRERPRLTAGQFVQPRGRGHVAELPVPLVAVEPARVPEDLLVVRTAVV